MHNNRFDRPPRIRSEKQVLSRSLRSRIITFFLFLVPPTLPSPPSLRDFYFSRFAVYPFCRCKSKSLRVGEREREKGRGWNDRYIRVRYCRRSKNYPPGVCRGNTRRLAISPVLREMQIAPHHAVYSYTASLPILFYWLPFLWGLCFSIDRIDGIVAGIR